MSRSLPLIYALAPILLVALSFSGCALGPAARVGSPGRMAAQLEREAGSDAAPSAELVMIGARTEIRDEEMLKPSTSEADAMKSGGKARGEKSVDASSPRRDHHEETVQSDKPASSTRITPPSFDARGLGPEECAAFLAGEGVEYERAEGPDMLAFYIRPKGAVGGVEYAFDGRSAVHEVMDCRLVAALVQWGPRLRSLGIRKVRHISAYRPGARVAQTGRRSGHASALALDLRYIELDDGRVLDVLEDWGDRRKGAAPCEEGRGARDPHPELRRLVCETIDDGIFQTIITPHRDKLHDNHVHLEIVPEVEWTFVR